MRIIAERSAANALPVVVVQTALSVRPSQHEAGRGSQDGFLPSVVGFSAYWCAGNHDGQP